MAEIDPAFEQQLADLSDEDWTALSARVRPPTSRGELKTVAAKIIQDEGQLNAFVSIANPKEFASENGDIDEARLTGHLTTLFGVSEEAQQSRPNYGQSSGNPVGGRAGDTARRALAVRHGVQHAAAEPSQGIRPGAAGREAAARRPGRTQK